jgi:branched-chain amino acid transport system substrate-binding protein
MNRRTLIITAALLSVLVALGACYDRPADPAGKDVRIAVNIPLSGPISSFSSEYVNGLRMGIEDGADAVGVAKDSFKIDAQDNQGQPSVAASIAQKQVLQGFDVYFSGVSQMSRAAFPIVSQVPATHFLVSYDAHLTEESPNNMRVLPHFKIEGPTFVNYAKQRGAKRVFAFTLNNPEIQGQYTEYIEPSVKAQGAEFAREVYEFTQTDFRTLALKAKQFKPDLVFVSGFSLHVLPILRALRAEGLIGDGNVLCIMDFNELLGGSVPAAEFNGVAYTAPAYSFPENRQAREAWAERYRARFGKVPNFVPAFAYDTGRLLALAKSKGGSVSRDAIRAQLPYTGVAGEIAVDQAGDLSTPLGVLKVRQDGSVERVQ